MSTLRNLLAVGNGKLGGNIHAWSIPAVDTCPGRSSLCESVCYAKGGRFRIGYVRARLQDNLELSLRDDFAERMIAEVKRRWVQVCRVHVAGDFFSPDYAAKWLQVFRACRKVKFYAYTRSWRVPEIEPGLREMARLRNVRLWYSADRETGVPALLPANVRVAWLLDREDADSETADLLFVVRRLRRSASRLALPVICPAETLQGKEKGTDCGLCGKCWR
jgi:hypothetical protein